MSCGKGWYPYCTPALRHAAQAMQVLLGALMLKLSHEMLAASQESRRSITNLPQVLDGADPVCLLEPDSLWLSGKVLARFSLQSI